MKRRSGLRLGLLAHHQLDEIARAERNVVLLMSGHRTFRRFGDPESVVRRADARTLHVNDGFGLAVDVTSDPPGYRCTACPLCDLIPVEEAQPGRFVEVGNA